MAASVSVFEASTTMHSNNDLSKLGSNSGGLLQVDLCLGCFAQACCCLQCFRTLIQLVHATGKRYLSNILQAACSLPTMPCSMQRHRVLCELVCNTNEQSQQLHQARAICNQYTVAQTWTPGHHKGLQKQDSFGSVLLHVMTKDHKGRSTWFHAWLSVRLLQVGMMSPGLCLHCLQ